MHKFSKIVFKNLCISSNPANFKNFSINFLLQAEIYIRSRNISNLDRYVPEKKLRLPISPDHPIVELQSPTVSYRMGVPAMGYGALVLTPGHPTTAEYSVLWVPGRYPQLFLYLACLMLVIVYIFFHAVFTYLFHLVRYISR
jgi:hypothetical protein